MRRLGLSVGTVVGTVVVVVALSGCVQQASPSGGPSGTSSASSLPSSTSTPTPTPTHTPDPTAGMSLAQQVGQLFMVGTTASAAQQVTLTAISSQHVGNVFLSGRSTAGVAATAAVVARLRGEVNAGSTDNIPLYVSTDQEGGEVQVLRGTGFSVMPTGVGQSQLSAATLQAQATTWSAQLKAAGVNMNLAPVVDLVGSPTAAASNPPIGAFQRELGFSVGSVVAHANAFRAGMSASGVQTVLKHFPGLGFVKANTDTSANVVDDTVGPNGADVGIYSTEFTGGAKYVMVSSATYKLIDPSSPAVFSSSVVTGLLRDKLGFTGLIMTDDLSGAVQVKYLTPANRAIDAIEAGVDIVLVSKYPAVAPGMVSAVLAKAQADPAFAALVTAAARRVVAQKAASIG